MGHDSCITGVGRTKFGVLDKGLPELAYESMLKALDDAATPIEDIEAIFVANFCAGPFQNQLHLNSLVSSLLPGSQIPIIRVETACAAAGSAAYLAGMSLTLFKKVIVLGVEKMSCTDSQSVTRNISSAGDSMIDQPEGLIFPAAYALIAQQHFLKYGTSTDDLDAVAYKNHSNANRNKLAHFFTKKVDMEMIRNSQMVCSPLRLFDCSPVSDGAAAIVMSAEMTCDRDIQVLASSISTDTLSLCQRKTLTSFKAAKAAASDAYRKASVTPEDIDIAEVHDCFTIGEIIALEDLGFCNPGEGGRMTREGRTMLAGDLPVNTNGGLKADGHPVGASGIAQIIEVVTQLRGEASERQVGDAKIGLTHNIGGVGGTAVVHILGGK